ncbi:hypothetical protein [Vibrio crassostreae]|uniref:hypothetical protein n=1 Tax=Vibrio crassostreae TaxID=246167 RepID=UPI001B312E7C|nr:hypothetical protein [Vibrio crassostreae]
MISSVSGGDYVNPALSATQSSLPSQKSMDAAQSFNALMIEKMLNQATDAKATNNKDFTYTMKQTEYLMNSQLADAISASSTNLTIQVAKEIEQ